MGGGSLDYAYERVNGALNELEESVQTGGNHPLLRRRLGRLLQACSDALYQIENSDSGDSGADDWVPVAEAAVAGCTPEPKNTTSAKSTAARRLGRLGLGDCVTTALSEDGKPQSLPILSVDGYQGTIEFGNNSVRIRFEANRRLQPATATATKVTDTDWEVRVGELAICRCSTAEEAETNRAEAAARAQREPARYWPHSICNRATNGKAVDENITWEAP